MDGRQGRLNQSVQLKLSLSLCLAILIIAIVAGIFSFLSAFDEAHELQDDVLQQVAQLLDRHPLPPSSSPVPAPAPSIGKPRTEETEEQSRVIVQRLGDRGTSLGGGDTGNALSLPSTMVDGLQSVEVGGDSYRVLVRRTATGERIAVAQEATFRNGIARDSALRTVMPFLLLVPVLLLIVAQLVRQMFRPIAALSNEIDRRAEQDLHPIEDRHLPIEVRPFALAINRLLDRVNKAMDAQRRFVADAAHELRSPLTALSLQAERLANTEMSDQTRDRLTVLRQGIERNRSLLDQLLSLARAQASSTSSDQPVSIQRIYRRVLEDLMPLAEARHVDIGVEGEQDALISVNELDLTAVVKNLVDNAIRYTPDGGRIDLSVDIGAGHVHLQIRDTGPGISLTERGRVFDPFYRTLGTEQTGSGLGLSIVKAIADRIGAEVRLEFADAQRQTGLCVTVLIPVTMSC